MEASTNKTLSSSTQHSLPPGETPAGGGAANCMPLSEKGVASGEEEDQCVVNCLKKAGVEITTKVVEAIPFSCRQANPGGRTLTRTPC